MNQFAPLTDYATYQHILAAGANWVHPGNGNVYLTACEQRGGINQDLSIYRSVGGAPPVLFRRYKGTVASTAQITMGACVIGQGGGLWVATSLIIPGAQKVTQTGFQGCYFREAHADDPWGEPAIYARLARIEAALGL